MADQYQPTPEITKQLVKYRLASLTKHLMEKLNLMARAENAEREGPK